MTTSALALNQLLAAAASHRPNTELVVDAIAMHLGLEPPASRPAVVNILFQKVDEIQKDIEDLPLDEASKKLCRKHIHPFRTITALSNLHLSIQHAQSQYLKHEHLTGLVNLHMALSGHLDRNDPKKDARELAAQFATLRRQVLEEDLPEEARRAVSTRMHQISVILEHFYAFGGDALKDELEALVGALVVNGHNTPPKNIKVFKQISALVVASFVLLKGIDASLEHVLSITENGDELLNLVGLKSDDSTTAK